MSADKVKPDLRVKVGSLEWPTPISLASGTCGYGKELDGLIDWSAVGAIFTKGLSLKPRKGTIPPRIWETSSGMLTAIGLEDMIAADLDAYEKLALDLAATGTGCRR